MDAIWNYEALKRVSNQHQPPGSIFLGDVKLPHNRV
jgi:hypothetical protein